MEAQKVTIHNMEELAKLRKELLRRILISEGLRHPQRSTSAGEKRKCTKNVPPA